MENKMKKKQADSNRRKYTKILYITTSLLTLSQLYNFPAFPIKNSSKEEMIQGETHTPLPVLSKGLEADQSDSHKNQARSIDEEVEDLQKEIQSISATIPEADPQAKPNRVIFLGKSRIGKTTLIHGLAGIPLTPENIRRGGIQIIPEKVIPGFHFQRGGIAGTRIPSVWKDANGVEYWDCPGFGDPRGAAKDIVNAFAIEKLFKNSSVKVMLAIDEYQLTSEGTKHFLDTLNEISKLLPEPGMIEKCLSLVVTKLDKVKPQQALEDILEEQKSLLAKGEAHGNKRVGDLLQFFVNNPDRIATFSSPQAQAQYRFDQEGILGSLRRSQYVDSPQIALRVGTDSREFSGKLAQRLNQNITNLVSEEGAQGFQNYCLTQLRNHVGTAAQIRTNLRGHIENLSNLQGRSQNNPLEFAEGLRDFFDVGNLRKNIDHINFLKRIDSDITHHVGAWSNALEESLRHIRHFSSEPTSRIADGVLTVQGAVIGSSDIQSALSPHVRAINSTSEVLFIDQNIEAPGVNVSFRAPHWKIIEERTIDLSGRAGADLPDRANQGQNGQLGNPGGNGGNFEAHGEIDGVERLSVNTSGGHGGRGQHGGHGVNGINGYDVTIADEALVNNGDDRALISTRALADNVWRGVFTANTMFEKIYQRDGIRGTVGGNAGRGGRGGLGGIPGTLVINGQIIPQHGNAQANPYPLRMTSLRGNPGADGDNGIPGQGGRHGNSYRRIYSDEIYAANVRQVQGANPGWGARTSNFFRSILFVDVSIASAVLASGWDGPGVHIDNGNAAPGGLNPGNPNN